jgi:hypothetical protein
MHILNFIFLFILSSIVACAQQSTPVENNPITVNPNTVRVIATVKSVTKESAVLTVQEVVATGQGIINTIAPGQEVTIKITAKEKEFLSGNRIQADLKEKLGVDASQSYYVLLTSMKLKSKPD